MKRKLFRVLVFLCIIVVTSKCSEVQHENLQQTAISVHTKTFTPSNFEFNGEYLIFDTPESFEETLTSIRNSDSKSVIEWSNRIGFNSYRVIYEKALSEQEKYLNELLLQYQSFSKSDLRLKQKPIITQPDFVLTHAKLLNFNDEGLIDGPSIPHYDITGLINKQGLVKVAGHLFQYNRDNIKIIIGGDKNKISLLDKTNVTNNKIKIIVNPVKQEKSKSYASTGRVWNDFYKKTNFGFSPVDLNINWEYFVISESQISYYVYPIYDTSTLICEPDGCGQARTMVGDCNCYYPISEYRAYSKYEAHMETRRVWMGLISFAYHSQSCSINIDYKVSNGPWNQSTYTTSGLANTYLTIYDGSPALEFTCANENFRALFQTGWDRTVTNSWCD